LSLDDNDPEILAWTSITSAFMVGDSESEIEMADRAVALNPNSHLAWHARGWVYKLLDCRRKRSVALNVPFG
jgi:adenylate cyclase